MVMTGTNNSDSSTSKGAPALLFLFAFNLCQRIVQVHYMNVPVNWIKVCKALVNEYDIGAPSSEVTSHYIFKQYFGKPEKGKSLMPRWWQS
jgi:hypothetical protein